MKISYTPSVTSGGGSYPPPGVTSACFYGSPENKAIINVTIARSNSRSASATKPAANMPVSLAQCIYEERGEGTIDTSVPPGYTCSLTQIPWCSPQIDIDFEFTFSETSNAKVRPVKLAMPCTLEPTPPPPSPAPTPFVDYWPVFANRTELVESASWSAYLVVVYGHLPPNDKYYPLRMSDFWCFYLDYLNSSDITPPASVGNCPIILAGMAFPPSGQRYDENNAYSSKDLTWLWHNGANSGEDPYQGFASNGLVEVSHEKDPFGDEHFGLWFVYAKGSGVYFNLGNTKVFQEHQDAYTFFGITCTDCDLNEHMSQAAAAAGEMRTQ
jgi:hypothetical protein